MSDILEMMKIIKNILLIFILLFFVSCSEEKNTGKFDAFIKKEYSKHTEKDNIIVDLKNIFPFKWEKIYIFSNVIYPEADAPVIRKITKTNYYGNRKYLENRLILFIKGEEIIFEVLTPYDNPEDLYTKDIMFVFKNDFKGYIDKENSLFKLDYDENSSSYILTSAPHLDI
jgi:hypothetical protein